MYHFNHSIFVAIENNIQQSYICYKLTCMWALLQYFPINPLDRMENKQTFGLDWSKCIDDDDDDVIER